MKAHKFTPGPWKVYLDDGVTVNVCHEIEGHIITLGQAEGENIEEARANASLIAAAPLLLEAVQTWWKFFDTMPKGQFGKLVFDVGLFNDGFIKSRAAIVAATGEQP